jgi:hypothetical protein
MLIVRNVWFEFGCGVGIFLGVRHEQLRRRE